MHRNTVYGHAEWARHKSAWRHGRHILTIISSGVIFAVGPPVVCCTLIAVLVAVFNHSVENGRFPPAVPLLHVPSLPFTLTAPVLALLLVFRTNSSYTRFDEARKAWGSNVNRTRDLARQALAWIRHPADLPKLHCLLRHIKAYSFCLKRHLTEESTLREELAGILEPGEVECVLNSQHRPNYVLQVMAEVITKCEVNPWEKIRMDDNLTQFHDNVGACERIFKTPIPLAYTRLTSRVLSLWHLALPVAVWNSCGWLTIPVTFMSSLALFYIEEVGVLVEEPFWILALSSISSGIVGAVDGLCVAHKEASLMWSSNGCSCSSRSIMQLPSNSNKGGNSDHVVITFDGSRSDGVRQHSEIDIGLPRVNSVA